MTWQSRYAPGAHSSLWQSTVIPSHPADAELERKFDLIIVGGGIVGVMLAHEVRALGANVLLVEARELVQGVSGHTTAKLTAQHGLVYKGLSDVDGRRYFEFNQSAVETVRASGIDCDLLECRAMVRCSDDRHYEDLAKEAEAYARLGIPGRLVDPGTLEMRGQAAFHPRKFLGEVARITRAAGVRMWTGARVERVEENGSECEVRMGGRTLRADQVCIATHFPIHDSDLFVTKLTPIRSYAGAFRLVEPPQPEMVITHEAETFRSYRPVRLEDGELGLIVGSGHHRVGEHAEVDDPYAELEAWARATFPVVRCEALWSTQDLWTPDGMPFIGRSPHRKRILMATGFGGWGMTTGIAAAGLLGALFENRAHDAASLFDPGRSVLGAMPKLVADNLRTAAHLAGDKFAGLGALDTGSLAPGAAAIGIEGGERRAAFRDAEGTVHKVASSCTHMGCQLLWNLVEATWDCPCHGSRFSHTGQVIHGPATEDLKRVPT